MGIFSDINIVTAAIICIFAIPILVGIIRPLTSERIHRSFASLLGSLILLASIILSVYLTRVILSGNENFVLTALYSVFPGFENSVANKELWVYIVFIVVLLLAAEGVLHLVTWPIYRYALVPMANGISSAVGSMKGFFRRIVGGLWQIPRSIALVLIFALLINFYTGFFNSSFITENANNSAPYQFVQEQVVQPLLNSSVVKDLKVILNDAFKAAENGGTDGADARGPRLIRYFNGVTLDEAVKSNTEIDDKALEIVGSEADGKQKAHLIYLWICKNIKYDDSKAAALAQSPSDISSGAITAFTTRKGVCFDFSCLYVAMCRAAGLNVRFLTGQGFTGETWGDHAWNEVYYPKEDRWINVDTTFGSSGINYFDRAYFYLDHKDGVIQGEW